MTMIMMGMLDRAIAIAREAHAGQVDKAGRPYIEHVLRVVDAVDAEDTKVVAALHDVLEDCEGWDYRRLMSRGILFTICDDVWALTRKSHQDYLVYISWLKVWATQRARAVKIADLRDNSDPARLALLPLKDRDRLRRKYAAALDQLGADPPGRGPGAGDRGEGDGMGREFDSSLVSATTPLRLSRAVELGWPQGGMTVSGLRLEASRGRLVIERVAGKDFVTLEAIERMRELCRVGQKGPASPSGRPSPTPAPAPSSRTPSGSSETERNHAARDALRARLNAPSKPSRPTSRRATSLIEPATVIPITLRSPTS